MTPATRPICLHSTRRSPVSSRSPVPWDPPIYQSARGFTKIAQAFPSPGTRLSFSGIAGEDAARPLGTINHEKQRAGGARLCCCLVAAYGGRAPRPPLWAPSRLSSRGRRNASADQLRNGALLRCAGRRGTGSGDGSSQWDDIIRRTTSQALPRTSMMRRFARTAPA